MSIDTRSLDAMLAELKATSALAQGKPAGAVGETGGADFAQVLKNTLEQVNQVQQSAQAMTTDFVSGQGNASLQDVMVNLQKANLSFQQMVQVRNKLVTAYQDIMNMSV